MYGLSSEHNVVPDPSVYAQELISDDQSLFDSSFNDPYKPLKPAHKSDGNFFNKKRPLEAELDEPLAKRPYVPNNDFAERNSPSPVPQNLSHEKRVIVPAGELKHILLINFCLRALDTPRDRVSLIDQLKHALARISPSTQRLGLWEVFCSLINRTLVKSKWPRPGLCDWKSSDYVQTTDHCNFSDKASGTKWVVKFFGVLIKTLNFNYSEIMFEISINRKTQI